MLCFLRGQWLFQKVCTLDSSYYLEWTPSVTSQRKWLSPLPPFHLWPTEHLSLHHKLHNSSHSCRKALQIWDRNKWARGVCKIYFPYLVRHQSPPGSHCFALQCRAWAIGKRVIDILVTLPWGKEKREREMKWILCFIRLRNAHHFSFVSYVLPTPPRLYLLFCFLRVIATQSRNASYG